AQLATDARFRQQVASCVRKTVGELAKAVDDGTLPAAADPVEAAALAYLLRPANWQDLVASAGATLRADADSAAVAVAVRDAEARVARAEHDRAVARVEADKLRDELARLREEVTSIREENRRLTRELRLARAAERRANELLATERGRDNRAAADHDAEVRRLRAKLAETEVLVGAARAAAKEARAVEDARVWLLLETIGQAAVALRRELAIEPADRLPADFVAEQEHAELPARSDQPARGLAADDPARLDQLLSLPRAHLVVDGYNVTKRGFNEISLEQQRGRLV